MNGVSLEIGTLSIMSCCVHMKLGVVSITGVVMQPYSGAHAFLVI